MPTLSICIPTYNRSKCLAELLDSIVDENAPETEVIISDDASPDDTPDIVAAYYDKIPLLKYIRQDPNIGLDRNFLAVVSSATHDYVWLMGDDDRLEPGSIRKVMTALSDWPGVAGLTLGVIDYDHDMKTATGIRAMPPTGFLPDADAVFSTLPELLGFMSALVVNRAMWETVSANDPIQDYTKYYIQVYILGRMLQRFGGWGVLNLPCVGFRTSNDQFLSKFGWLKRLKMDVIAYEELADGLFGDHPQTRRTMRKRVFNTHVMARIRNAKTRPGPTTEIFPAISFLFQYYKEIPAFWYSAVPTLLVPDAALRFIRSKYQQYGRSSGARRAKLMAS